MPTLFSGASALHGASWPMVKLPPKQLYRPASRTRVTDPRLRPPTRHYADPLSSGHRLIQAVTCNFVQYAVSPSCDL